MHAAITISPPLTVDKDYAKTSSKLIWDEHIDLVQKGLVDANVTAVEKQEKCFLLAIALFNVRRVQKMAALSLLAKIGRVVFDWNWRRKYPVKPLFYKAFRFI